MDSTRCDEGLISNLTSSQNSRSEKAYNSHQQHQYCVKTITRYVNTYVPNLLSRGGLEPTAKYKGDTFTGIKATKTIANSSQMSFLQIYHRWIGPRVSIVVIM